MSTKSALVAGATGFIGRHLVDGLLDAQARVTVLVRPESRVPENLRERVGVITCDDWSRPGIRRALGSQEFDAVFHLAAYGVNPAGRDIDQMLRTNVEVAVALVHVCKEIGARLLIAGSSAEYRAPLGPAPASEDSPLEDGKLYGASKAAGSLLASALAAQLGVPLRVLRLFNVYGPGEAAHRLLPSLVAGLSAGRRVALSEGTQIRDFVYVGDVVRAFLLADARMQSGPPTATWNVCTGMGHAVRTFATMTADILGADVALLGFGDLGMRPDEVPSLIGSCERLRAGTGWQPAYDLETGLRESVGILMNTTKDAGRFTGGRS